MGELTTKAIFLQHGLGQHGGGMKHFRLGLMQGSGQQGGGQHTYHAIDACEIILRGKDNGDEDIEDYFWEHWIGWTPRRTRWHGCTTWATWIYMQMKGATAFI